MEPTDQSFQLRQATSDDVDAMADIACAAFPADPQWNYRLTNRTMYPADTWACEREAYMQVMNADMSNDWRFNVVTSPSKGNPDVRATVAFAIWKFGYPAVPTNDGSKGDCANRRDINYARNTAFFSTLESGSREYFNEKYGHQQLHLTALATHPDYQRQGAGTLHCKWGIQQAKLKNLTITLFATHLGHTLYDTLGFKRLDSLTVELPDDEGKVILVPTVLELED